MPRRQHDSPARGIVRGDRLAIEGDHLRSMAVELQREDARVGRVEQPQALAGAQRDLGRHHAVDVDDVADAGILLPPGEAVQQFLADLRRRGAAGQHVFHAVDFGRLRWRAPWYC